MVLFKVLSRLFIFVLLFAGCASVPFTDEWRAREVMEGVTQFYQARATVRSGELYTEISIFRPDPMTTHAQVLSPERVAGLGYIFHEGGVELSYHGLSVSLDSFGGALGLPVVRGISALSAILLPTAERELPTLQQDGLWLLHTELADGECLLFLNGEGVPLKLLLPEWDVEFIFEDFTFLG